MLHWGLSVPLCLWLGGHYVASQTSLGEPWFFVVLSVPPTPAAPHYLSVYITIPHTPLPTSVCLSYNCLLVTSTLSGACLLPPHVLGSNITLVVWCLWKISPALEKSQATDWFILTSAGSEDLSWHMRSETYFLRVRLPHLAFPSSPVIRRFDQKVSHYRNVAIPVARLTLLTSYQLLKEMREMK